MNGCPPLLTPASRGREGFLRHILPPNRRKFRMLKPRCHSQISAAQTLHLYAGQQHVHLCIWKPRPLFPSNSLQAVVIGHRFLSHCHLPAPPPQQVKACSWALDDVLACGWADIDCKSCAPNARQPCASGVRRQDARHRSLR